MTPEHWSLKILIDACDRLLKIKEEVMAMDEESRAWFMDKPGHRDCLIVASALKAILEDPRTQETD
jgi:hypothetical protein